jgi:hypothetical protein
VQTVEEELGVSEEMARRLFEKAKSGGFTARFPTGIEPVSGYSVSTYPDRSLVIPFAEFRAGDLALYVKKNSDLLTKPHHHLGAWREVGPDVDRVWLDVSIVEDGAEEAFKVAREADQIAIYDLSLGEVLEAGGTGGRSTRAATRKARLERWTMPEGIPDAEMLRIFFASLKTRR